MIQELLLKTGEQYDAPAMSRLNVDWQRYWYLGLRHNALYTKAQLLTKEYGITIPDAENVVYPVGFASYINHWDALVDYYSRLSDTLTPLNMDFDPTVASQLSLQMSRLNTDTEASFQTVLNWASQLYFITHSISLSGVDINRVKPSMQIGIQAAVNVRRAIELGNGSVYWQNAQSEYQNYYASLNQFHQTL